MKEENTPKVDEREFFYSIVLNVISKNYFYFYCRKSAYVLNLLFCHRNFRIILFFAFCLGACVPFSQQGKYPYLRKVTVETKRNLDSIIIKQFSESKPASPHELTKTESIQSDSVGFSFEEKKDKSLVFSNITEQLVENYFFLSNKLQNNSLSKNRSSKASLTQASFPKILAVLITLVIIALLVLLALWLIELTEGNSCLGCGVVFLILGFAVLLLLGLLSYIF